MDATILVPTHRHAAFLPFALRSALDQEDATIEVFVVGDGVEDATRVIVESFAHDPRVRFFDLPKGPRNGEAYRHDVLQEANGRLITYLSDDDLLLRDHIAIMRTLLANADLAHSAPALLKPDDGLVYYPWDIANQDFVWLMHTGHNSMGLTSATHTSEAYLRLPHGWRTTPSGIETDRYMWMQWLEQPWVRAVTSRRLTHLQFPDPMWRDISDDERVDIVSTWLERSRRPGFRTEIDSMLEEAVVRAGERFRLKARRYQLALQSVQATRTWRLRERVFALRARKAS
ncbi:MAG TPA: glycosyltransferase [Gaiellaceae bacterium]|nr:glycosyltransferase [Gaiellaceae bacterium]